MIPANAALESWAPFNYNGLGTSGKWARLVWILHDATGGGVLHLRFLRLGKVAGSLDLLGGTAKTEAADAHLLFSGARRFVVTFVIT